MLFKFSNQSLLLLSCLTLAFSTIGCSNAESQTNATKSGTQAVTSSKTQQTQTTSGTNKPMTGKLIKGDDEWKKELSPEVYEITRRGGTERAFTGKYYDTKTPGVYRCSNCGEVLFDSSDKYDSGCGWPSFTKPADKKVVDEHTDTRFGMERTEVVCNHCGAHLGHVFDDGPAPTNLRYCINSASLKLEEKK